MRRCEVGVFGLLGASDVVGRRRRSDQRATDYAGGHARGFICPSPVTKRKSFRIMSISVLFLRAVPLLVPLSRSCGGLVRARSDDGSCVQGSSHASRALLFGALCPLPSMSCSFSRASPEWRAGTWFPMLLTDHTASTGVGARAHKSAEHRRADARSVAEVPDGFRLSGSAPIFR